MVGCDEDSRKHHLKVWPHAPGYFWNGDFFLRFAKKYTSTRSIFESFSPVHTKTLNNGKSLENRLHPSQSMRYASSKWCITSWYSKTSVFVRPHVNEGPEVLKRYIFGDRFNRIRVDGRPNRRKKISVFKQKWIHVDAALVCVEI